MRFWRFHAPDGRTGPARYTVPEARQDAVRVAARRAIGDPPLAPGVVAQLWRGLERTGWRIEENPRL